MWGVSECMRCETVNESVVSVFTSTVLATNSLHSDDAHLNNKQTNKQTYKGREAVSLCARVHTCDVLRFKVLVLLALRTW